MTSQPQISKRSIIIGWVLSGLAVLFLLFDSIGKFIKPEAVVKGTLELGYPENLITVLGIILLICLIVYVIPRSAFFGAILLTAYLGGAIATHVRLENPLFTHILFPVYLALLLWIGLYLRNNDLRRMIAGKRSVHG